MRGLLVVLILWCVAFVNGYIVRPFPKAEPTGRGDEMVAKLRMPAARPSLDGYPQMCAMFSLEGIGEIELIQFKVVGNADIAHHLNLFGTSEVFTREKDESDDPWECSSAEPIFVWAKNAPPTRLPPSVGFKVGGKNKIQTLQLQIHYSNATLSAEKLDFSGYDVYFTRKPQKYAAGFLLFNIRSGSFPPHQPMATLDACCKIKSRIHIMAYFAHQHGIGRLMSSYRVKKNTTEFQEIGKGNAQWPQAFFPVREIVDVEPGDTIAIRCIFDSTKTKTTTYMNAKPKDVDGGIDMCYLNALYYTDPQLEEVAPFSIGCDEDEHCSSDLVFPAAASELLPPNPRLEQQAKFGNQTGIVKINENVFLNLDLQQLTRNLPRPTHRNRVDMFDQNH